MEIVALSHLDWSVCIGGSHITGKIVRRDHPDVELTRTLSRTERKEHQEKEGRYGFNFPEERTTNKFTSIAQLEKAALKWCNKHLGEEWLLQHNTTLNPEMPIGGKGWVVDRLTALETLAKLWDDIPNAQRDGTVWKAAYGLYDLLTKPPAHLTPTKPVVSSDSYERLQD
jgi:hypothetical protein